MVFNLDAYGFRAQLAALLLAVAAVAATLASPARASIGYELDSSTPSRDLDGVGRGIAVDQASQDIYVAIVSTNPSTGTPGEIERFNSDLSADGVFAKGDGYYSGVAVDPLTHGFYGAQMLLKTIIGDLGRPRLDRFSSSGASAGSFDLTDARALPPIATDSAGDIFYPNLQEHSVKVYSSAGVLQEEITCSGCPEGSFGKPLSVATDAADNLYVADFAPDRVVKLTPSGGTYSFASVLQSGRGAVAVGVDPATGDVLVGDMPNERDYHIVAYNSSGTQFDDFGAGIFPDPFPQDGVLDGYQMAVDATTHKLYVGEYERFYIFDKVAITPPTGTIKPASDVGQLTATLNATVNAHGHAALDCEFEYTDDADVAFANATSLPCPENPDGASDTALGAKASGLSPSTAYRYRVTATSNAGTVVSGSATFETLPEIPPTVTTESPFSVTQSTATIKGKVNPHGGSASDCHFELGASVLYGSSFGCSTLPGPVTTDVTETRKPPGLTPSTTYHYRLVVTTNAGTTNGEDVEFTTASPPSEPEPEKPAPTPGTTAPPATTAPPPSAAPSAPPRPRRCKKGFHRRKIRGKVRCVKKLNEQGHRAHR